MSNFATLLKRPAGEAKKPESLPTDVYPGIVTKYEIGDENKNKTPYVRVHFRVIDGGVVHSREELNALGIDLSKKAFRKDFYLTDDALWRLDEFIRSLGIDPANREYDEVLSELTNQSIKAQIKQIPSQDGSSLVNQVDQIIGG